MSKITKKVDFAGRELIIETGFLAPQANCAVKLQYGDTVVLVTATAGGVKEELSYFPLSVDYEEKYYAGGRISGSRFVKRETKPKDTAILKARLIDRSIRPLFPKDYYNETQIIVTILSIDKENDPGIISLIGASLALSLSDIPWNGPIAGMRVGKKDGKLILNPVNDDLEVSTLDLIVSSTKENIVMIEAGAQEVEEDDLVEALRLAQEENTKLVTLFEKFVAEMGKEKMSYDVKEEPPVNEKIIDYISKNKTKTLLSHEVEERKIATDEFLENLYKKFEGKTTKDSMKEVFEGEIKNMIRENIVNKGDRPDGRDVKEVRSIYSEVGLFPRTHGSGLFQRGLTQVLSIVTLGSTSLEQLIENMEGEEKKRFMHHYNFPPYSVGEVRRLAFPPRRSIGHGALAEKAIEQMIPLKENFPYTIRVVSECLSSSGSTSMGAVCGLTLSLMDAGVPIKKPVAGIAMGIVFKDSKYKVLTDIQALEDHYGDMDFKVAGTKDGITAIQLDVKSIKLTVDILVEALAQAKEGRLHILGKILEAISKPRKQLSEYAPKVEVIKIDPKKIREVIGAGGKVINKIIEETNTEIDIDDDGTVSVSGEDYDGLRRAVKIIEDIVKEVKAGEIYEGEVVKLMDFGAFVQFLPGKSGMVHISQITDHHVNKIEDELKMGQKVKVKVREIDDRGRINLTMKLEGGDNKETRGKKDFKKGKSFDKKKKY